MNNRIVIKALDKILGSDITDIVVQYCRKSLLDCGDRFLFTDDSGAWDKFSSWKKFLKHRKDQKEYDDDDYVVLAFGVYKNVQSIKLIMKYLGDDEITTWEICITGNDEEQVLQYLKNHQFRHFHLLDLYLQDICLYDNGTDERSEEGAKPRSPDGSENDENEEEEET
jgi:hypothetical protein